MRWRRDLVRSILFSKQLFQVRMLKLNIAYVVIAWCIYPFEILGVLCSLLNFFVSFGEMRKHSLKTEHYEMKNPSVIYTLYGYFNFYFAKKACRHLIGWHFIRSIIYQRTFRQRDRFLRALSKFYIKCITLKMFYLSSEFVIGAPTYLDSKITNQFMKGILRRALT